MQSITPNKSLGQNFFTNASLARKIVDIVVESDPSHIIEIGPGPGTFTNLLAERAQVIAIEKDHQFEMVLSQIDNLEVLYQDILETDFHEILMKWELEAEKVVIFGSLPYNISKRIIANNLRSSLIQNQYYIIQKEVAEKYIANAPQNNILSLTSEVYSQCNKLFDISPGSFNPPPKVTSSFIKFTLNATGEIHENAEELCKFISSSFSHPRKTLNNNLKNYSEEIHDKELLQMRPSQLTLDQYVELFNQLKR
ncbi:MAG: 16S rRNA (adenine(1518)-N(6)/adenine(1519)-N(6))-dimethyltransferase RsmA [Candidatus Dojkabacteria bacterium]|nr:MAG: 16S rRNA (adenine(1518)-N(6)/adenine(1519)-N(6))-dimethyltransferase RsmA [Candidatus Dojkabacteria bacterium]